MGSQRVRHDWVTNTFTSACVSHCRQHAIVFASNSKMSFHDRTCPCSPFLVSHPYVASKFQVWAYLFPGSSVGKESTCNAGDPGLIPRSGRSAGEGIGYPLQYSWAFLVAQLVKNLPAMWETWIRSLCWEDSGGEGKGYPPQYPGSCQSTISLYIAKSRHFVQMEHVVLYVQLLSLSIFSEFIHVVACIISTSFLLPNNIPLYGHTVFYLSMHHLMN